MEPDPIVPSETIDLAEPATVERVLPGLAEVWRETQGLRDILIAVIDGVVDRSHPCLAGALLRDGAALAPAETPSSHGTHVASLIFGQGEPGGVAGIAPGCSGLLLPVFGQTGEGLPVPCSQTTLARAINSACSAGAHVINISGGELTPAGEAGEYLRQAVQGAADRDVLIVAAAGNDGCECLHVPAALPAVLAVGALGPDGYPLAMSNWGGPLLQQGVMAPGWRLVGAAPGGGTVARTGTSFAAPLVSGVAALLLSLQLQNGMTPDPLAVSEALLASAAGGCDESPAPQCRRLLAGRLDIRRALQHLGLQVGVTPAGGGASLLINAVPRKETGMNEISSGTHMAPPPPAAAPAGEASGVTPSCACSTGLAGRPGGGGPGISEIQASAVDEAPVAAAAIASAPGLSPATAAGRTTLSPPALGSRAGAWPQGQGAGVQPSQSTASNCAGLTDLVFALGELGYDFGCEARLDYFVQQMGSISNAFNPVCMALYLNGPESLTDLSKATGAATAPATGKGMASSPVPQPCPGLPEGKHSEDANALLWTLNVDTTPVYVIEPDDQFAMLSYARLIEFLFAQYFNPNPGGGDDAGSSSTGNVYRVAIAGRISGSTRLYNGTVLPLVKPVTRGMYNWNVNLLLGELLGQQPWSNEQAQQGQAIKDFLLRIYYALRNLGQSDQERALNFAGTNAYNAGQVFQEAISKGLVLDHFDVTRSPICRPESNCWDVQMYFFNPNGIFQDARTVYRYTIDVSDIVPVTVGPLRSWQVYSNPLN